jgi:predicted peroxiredoxin
MIACLLGMSLNLASPTLAQETQISKPVEQKVFVKLDHFTDDLHSVYMALKLANGLQQTENHVTLFLNLEAVRLADSRHPLELGWGPNKSLAPLYQAFINGGGQILVCPHCAKAAGLDAEDIREGAQIAEDNQVIEALNAADKTLSY